MAINLLGNLNNPFQQQKPQTGGMSVPKPQPAGTVGMSTPAGPKYVPVQQPMGVTAKNPASSAPTPSTTLPKTQQNPVNTPPVDTNYYMKPGESSADYTARIAQYNASKNGGSTGSTNPHTPPTNPPAPEEPQPPTFSGLLGQAVSTAKQGAPQASQYAQQAAQYGAGSIPIAAQANDIAQQFGQKYADIGQQGARFQAGQLTTGTSPVAEGNAAITAQTTAAQQQALAQGEQAALQGIGYGLTGQQQAAQAAQAASGVPLSIYGTQLGALQNAYTAAAPQLGSPYQIPFSPADQSQGAPLGSTAPGGLNSLAQNYGTFQGIQQGAQAAAAAPGQGQAAVTGAPYQATASNIQTAGTATPTAYNSIYQGALNDYTNLQQSVQNVDQFGNLLTSNMAQGGINPTDVKYANMTLSQIRNQLSSGAQAQYDTTLAALRSKVSGMLSIGGSETPTAITADAQKILDGSLPLSSLNDVLSRIQTEGNILLTNQAEKVNAAKAGTQAPGTQTTSTNTSGAQGWL